MNKTLRVFALIGSLWVAPALAADNATIVTPGVGVTLRSVDVGSGVQAVGHALVNASGTQIGVAGAGVFVEGRGSAGTPAGSVLTVQGVGSMTPFLSNPGTPANWGIGATGAAVPANASYMGIISGGNLVGWTGAVTIASGGVASGAVASGAFASGSIASGAMAAGSHAAGSGVDGWDLTQGAIADAVVAAGATGSVSAKLRRLTTDMGAAATSLASIDTKASQPLPAQSGIGNVNIGAVQSAGSQYETVAASQTAQALGATGATGDYLSHCVIYPVTTGAGAVTVFDNANAAATNVITFTSGTLSNLAPIAIPVGAISTAGAWKVTTGANVTVTCYVKFT